MLTERRAVRPFELAPPVTSTHKVTVRAELARDDMPEDEYAAMLRRVMSCPSDCTCRGEQMATDINGTTFQVGRLVQWGNELRPYCNMCDHNPCECRGGHA